MTEVTDQGFEAFFRAEHRKLIAIGAALTGSVEVGQELAQEAFSRAFVRWDRISGYEQAGAWIRRVVINLAIDTNRRRGNERVALGRLPQQHSLIPDDSASDEWWTSVRRLPDRQRAAVTLYYVEDMSVEEVARVLDVAVGTVKATLSKARAALTSMLREEDPS